MRSKSGKIGKTAALVESKEAFDDEYFHELVATLAAALESGFMSRINCTSPGSPQRSRGQTTKPPLVAERPSPT